MGKKTYVLQRVSLESEMATLSVGNIFANHVSDKGLISRIYKQQTELNN